MRPSAFRGLCKTNLNLYRNDAHRDVSEFQKMGQTLELDRLPSQHPSLLCIAPGCFVPVKLHFELLRPVCGPET